MTHAATESSEQSTHTAALRRVSASGFRGAHAGKLFLGGALAGFALLCALVLLLHHLDLVIFRGQVLFGETAQWQLGLKWLGLALLFVLAQEAMLRGYLQYALTRLFTWLLRRCGLTDLALPIGFGIGAAVLSSLAALAQLRGGHSPIGIVNVFLFGLLLAYSLWRTGSLWWATGFHLMWNWAQSFVWGVPSSGLPTHDRLFLTEPIGDVLRSGGATGPEGSVYMLGALVAAFGIVSLLHPRRVYHDLWAEAARDDRIR